jgi:hypothetical protein
MGETACSALIVSIGGGGPGFQTGPQRGKALDTKVKVTVMMRMVSLAKKFIVLL